MVFKPTICHWPKPHGPTWECWISVYHSKHGPIWECMHKGLQAAVGQREIISKGKHIHIVCSCGCLLDSYAAGQNCIGQHEGVESQPTIRSMGPYTDIYTCGPMSGFLIHTTIIYVFLLQLLRQSMRHGLLTWHPYGWLWAAKIVDLERFAPFPKARSCYHLYCVARHSVEILPSWETWPFLDLDLPALFPIYCVPTRKCHWQRNWRKCTSLN